MVEGCDTVEDFSLNDECASFKCAGVNKFFGFLMSPLNNDEVVVKRFTSYKKTKVPR